MIPIWINDQLKLLSWSTLSFFASSHNVKKQAAMLSLTRVKGMACWIADRAIDAIRDRFGWEAVGYGSVALELCRSVPDAFGELAEREL